MSSYFIKIDDGPDVRRRLLESSKASLHTLRGYQELIKIRNEKLGLMSTLRRQMKEVTVLLNYAESLMPQLSERELAELQPKAAPKNAPEGQWVKKGNRKVYITAPKRRVETQIPIASQSLAPAQQDRPKNLTELERLETALSAIDKKLGNL